MTEVKQTYKAKSKAIENCNKAEKIVNVVLNELKLRNGFNEIFPKIPEDIMVELHTTLSRLVKEAM